VDEVDDERPELVLDGDTARRHEGRSRFRMTQATAVKIVGST
jgi:hypothetical protein